MLSALELATRICGAIISAMLLLLLLLLLETVSSLPLCLSGGGQMMHQGIIRSSLGDASRHHQGVKD